MAKKSYNDIRNINEDWSFDDREDLPYSGKSVQDFLKKTLNEKGGIFHYDEQTTKYLIFANQENCDLYISDRELYADLLLGSFDAPANYTAEIKLISKPVNVILDGTTGNYIEFSFSITNRSGGFVDDPAVVTYTFTSGGSSRTETRLYEAGMNVQFLVDDYLKTGTNRINISLVGRNTLAKTMVSVTYTSVNLDFTSDFKFTTPVTEGSHLRIPYTLEGVSNVKSIEWYIDGVKDSVIDTVTGVKVSQTKDIDITGLSVGKHNVQGRAFIVEDETNYYSKTLYFDFVIEPYNKEWDSSVTFVLLGLVLDDVFIPESGNAIQITTRQYETIEYKAGIFDSIERELSLLISDISDSGVEQRSLTPGVGEVANISYTPTTIGNHRIVLSADGYSSEFNINTVKGDISIEETTDGLLLKLSAKNRSNQESEEDRCKWEYKQSQAQGGATISTVFSSGFEWNKTSGWNNGALIIPANSYITINLNPLDGDPMERGRTIELDFETDRTIDEGATVINLTNGSGDSAYGLNITASKARLQTRGKASVETRFSDGEETHLTFIINEEDDANNRRMLYIVNNGILEKASQFQVNDSIGVDGNSLTIGSTGCNIKLYGIRVYDKALSVDQSFCNYAIDNKNLVEIASFNDIYDEMGNISPDKVNSYIPIMIITGDISYIMSINDKSHKNDWNTYPVNIEFRNMQEPSMNFFIDDADIRLQGTSSISYPRKNFRIYSKGKSGKYSTKFYTPTHNDSDLVVGGKYAFRNGSAPVTCWCLKADFAESSGSHNTGIARLWNTLMKNTNRNGNYILRTDAQNWAVENEYPYDVRTTVDGFPIVLFQRDTDKSPLVCFGQYNFNNDKSTEDVYGFTQLSKEGVEPFDNSGVECWEVLDSDNSIALFTDISNFDSDWDNAFEARYTNNEEVGVSRLKTVATFINSCYNKSSDTIDILRWREGKASHFDLNKLAAYYVYLLRFGAVDQTVKNAMFTTYDGQHWFYINYDNDTILGIDNASNQFDVWDYGLFTRTPDGGYYYAGKGKSVIWRCFEADDECMSLAREIDKLLFDAGLNYNNVCKMFDDEQSGRWCERIYNENGRYKYISQAIAGQGGVLHMLQGSRKSHRHWWLQHRFEKYDNLFGNGTYAIRSIQARATGTVDIPSGSTYTYVPAITSYFGYSVASTTIDAPTEREAGVTYTSKGLEHDTGVGNLIYIYNANNIRDIDFSNYINALGTLDVSHAVDINGDSRIKKLILGDGTNENTFLSTIDGLLNLKSLEELDIRGYRGITGLALEDKEKKQALSNLKIFNAKNSGLKIFQPAEGSKLTTVTLPDAIQSISINNCSVTSMVYTPQSELYRVELRNVTGGWNIQTFVFNWLRGLSSEKLSEAQVVLEGINWKNVSPEDAIRLGSTKSSARNLRGRITLSSLTQNQYNQLLELFGRSVFNEDSAFVIDAPANVFITGPSELVGTEEGQFSAMIFPIGPGEIKYKLLYQGDEIEPRIDSEGNVYREYMGVTLYEASGIIRVGRELTRDLTFAITAGRDGGRTSSVIFVAKKLTLPSTLNLDGKYFIVKISSNTYNVVYDPSEFTAKVDSAAWSITENQYCSITSYDNQSVVLGVTSIPVNVEVPITITCVVTFKSGDTITGTRTVTIKEPLKYEAVDLGLSSGKLWSNANIGAEEYITDSGLYFAWGEIEGYESAEDRNEKLTNKYGTTFTGGFDSIAYSATGAASITSNLTPDVDPARQNMGGEWYTPSHTEFTEMFNGTDKEVTTINDVIGYKFMKKTDHSVYIFIPASGYYDGNVYYEPSKNFFNNRLWTRTILTSNINYSYYAFMALPPQTTTSGYDDTNRFFGTRVRGIKKKPKPIGFVDLDLPSGRYWASTNLGAENEWDSGLYFAWGEIDGHESAGDRNEKLAQKYGTTFTGGFDSIAYSATGASNISGNLTPSQDAASVYYGDTSYMIPTRDDWYELFNGNNTDYEIVKNYQGTGINGYKFMKKTDHSVYIFIPASGYYDGNTLSLYNSIGYYWSSRYSDSSNASTARLYINSSYDINYFYRRCGESIRAIC